MVAMPVAHVRHCFNDEKRGLSMPEPRAPSGKYMPATDSHGAGPDFHAILAAKLDTTGNAKYPPTKMKIIKLYLSMGLQNALACGCPVFDKRVQTAVGQRVFV